MSPFFDDLEAQLHAAAVARTAAQRAAPQRWFRRLRRGGRLTAVLAAVLVPLAVAAAVLTVNGSGGVRHAGSPGGPPTRPVLHLAAKYFNVAWSKTLRRDPACARRGGIFQRPGGVSGGTPSHALLSILGVLRRPATSADRIPKWKGGLGLPGALYVRYFRLARVESGVHYYVAVTHLSESPAIPRRCRSEVRSALKRELPRTLSHSERIQILRSSESIGHVPGGPTAPRDAVFLIGRGGVGGGDAPQLERMGLIGATGLTIYGVVPDGVASLQLPLRPLRGYPPLTLTATVINNVFVARAPRFDLPTGEVWLSRTGAVIRRVDLNR